MTCNLFWMEESIFLRKQIQVLLEMTTPARLYIKFMAQYTYCRVHYDIIRLSL